MSEKPFYPVENHYTLDENRQIVKASNLFEWAAWMETGDRRVAHTQVRFPPGKRIYLVCTDFLGIDHNFYGGKPILFETMIFYQDQNQRRRLLASLDYQARYSHYNIAEFGHWHTVRRLQTGKLYEEIP